MARVILKPLHILLFVGDLYSQTYIIANREEVVVNRQPYCPYNRIQFTRHQTHNTPRLIILYAIITYPPRTPPYSLLNPNSCKHILRSS